MDVLKSTRKMTGFTLIELLIVVAIIAILAAIAVPNFLEAQVRAKLSAAKSDMRSLGIALDSYLVDNNTYPRDHDNIAYSGQYRWAAWNGNRNEQQVGWLYLTTPIAYITTLAQDPFSEMIQAGVDTIGSKKLAPYYILASGADNYLWGYNKVQAYMIISFGPDKMDDIAGEDFWPSDNQTIGMGHYDGTNGTKSRGDLFRFGGQYLTGDWELWGVRYDQWNVGISLP